MNRTGCRHGNDLFGLSLWLCQSIHDFNKLERIYGDAVYLNAPVKMGATDSAGGAAQTDQLTFFNTLADRRLNLAQVGINREYFRPVVNDDGITGIKEIFRYSDNS